MNRRYFLQLSGGSAAALSMLGLAAAEKTAASVSAAKLPRWRGFNLLEKFTAGRQAPFVETDFIWMREWGFDFARLPLSYHCWADPNDWLNLREKTLQEIDQAVEFGRKHGVHVNINFHRAPGYCVNPPKEPLDLWSDEKALEACAFHWAHFAKRYKGRPNTEVSFDLLNEPADIPEATYARVVKRLVEAIRREDRDRLIIADGGSGGTIPVSSLAELGIGKARAAMLQPASAITKQAGCAGRSMARADLAADHQENDVWDKERLRRENIEPWKELAKKGVGVHVGECGAFQHTPHKVVRAWLGDCLELWQEAGWGWALWNLRGSFGIVDSDRKDVAYEDFRGHKLDRALLELLQAH